MRNKYNISQQRFGRLTAIKIAFKTNSGYYKWLCKCDCGNECNVRVASLLSGETKSCGCWNIECTKNRFKIHGQSKNKNGKKTPEYCAWDNMKRRCYNETHPSYKNYGGRGITVCHRWRISFEMFFKDMSERPSMEHSIERIKNNGNYNKANCYWALKHQQVRNVRTNVWIDYNGKRLIKSDVAKRLGVKITSFDYQFKKLGSTNAIKYFERRI